MSPPDVASSSSNPLSRLPSARWALWSTLALMMLQGALGIYLNLYVSLPTPSDPNAVFPIIFSNPVLAAHFLNAFALMGLSIFLIVVAPRTGIAGLRAWSGLLLAAFVAAGYSGYHFTGTEENGYSFAMEMAFFAAVVLVVVLIYRSGTPTGAAQDRSSPEADRTPMKG
jgi:uncharacterized membrane protein